MFHPSVVNQRFLQGVDVLRTADPTLSPEPVDATSAEEWMDRLGAEPRSLSAEELAFVVGQLALCKADFRYWATRYAKIKGKRGEQNRVVFMESQEIILRKVAEVELQCVQGSRHDGVLIQILKARQLGASTLAELIIAHRCFFYGNLLALVAGDVPEQSAYLFDMLERVYNNLPWWMRPTKTNHVKDYEMYFGGVDSLVRMGSGKSTRGGFNLEQGRGQLGRGKTINLFHGSELSTWDEPTQIDAAVEPAIPPYKNSFGFLESTARGQDNWWHRTWLTSVKGLGRWVPVFIPWYAETQTYRAPAPEGWEPSSLAKHHAAHAERVSQVWCGRQITLERDQLYWWERAYLTAKEKRLLHIFLAEYCADPDEAFTSTEGSVFGGEQLYRLSQAAKPLKGVIEIGMRS